MPENEDLGHLPSNEWEHLQEVASRFEKDWSSAESVELAGYLPRDGTPERRVTLLELIKTELELRWKRGKIVGLEYYVEKFPELTRDGGLPAELIYEEYRVRHLHGDKPQLESYRTRFPDQFEAVRRIVDSQPVVTQMPPALAPTPAASISMPAPPADIQQLNLGGSFRPIKRLGSGGFGEVWVAEAPGGIEVGLKIVFRPLDHSEAQRELQALELIKRLRHPFLLQTQSFHQVQDRLYIVMELADGSLRDRLKQCVKEGMKGIPPKELVQYFLESAEALDYLHENKVQHRDIKPENILMIGRHAKVADFGLAKLQEGSRMATATGSGTPLYMAPEIWHGKVSEHSDQYSLALAYAELRMARRVFASTDMMQIMIDHLEKQPEFPELPESEAAVLKKALAKQPEERYVSCLAFALALQDAVGGELRRYSGEYPVGPAAGTAIKTAANTAGGYAARTVVPPTVLGDGPDTQATPVGLSATATGAVQQPVQHPWNERPPAPPKKKPMLIATIVGAPLLAIVLGLAYYASNGSGNSTETTQSGVGGGGADVKSARIPVGFEKAADAKIIKDEVSGREFFDEITLKKGDQIVHFRLIPQTGESNEPAFYMMRTKVWRDLFKLAVNDPEFIKRLQGFEKADMPWLVHKKWSVDGNGRLPVTNVTVTEAYCFAQWLGGNLPTVVQWDRAAGRFERNRGLGPFEGKWLEGDTGIAIGGRKQLEPVETMERDRSLFGIRDLAGNGLEWTRTAFRAGETVPLRAPQIDDGVILRGKDFSLQQPFQFKDVEGSTPFDQEDYGKTAQEISFRVVLPTL